MDLSKLTQSEKIILGAGAALLIVLVALPWHKYPFVLADLVRSPSYNRTAIQSPGSFWGVLALLAVAAMVAVVVATRFTSAKVPDLPLPLGQAMFFAGVGVAALLVIKLIADTDFLAFGAYLGVLLGGAMAYGGVLYRKEAGDSPAEPPARPL